MKQFLNSFLFFILIISLVSVSSVHSSDIPQTLNYQGNLTDNTGQPLSGTKQITFALYDVASGGTALWTETQTIVLKDGRFSVTLGSISPLNAAIFTGETFLGLKVESNAEMEPRQKLTSVAYALKSLEVVNLPNIPDPIPSGIIVMWSGSSDSIPQGWALCDGNNGTPNLTDRFLIGAGNTYNVGSTGGSTTTDITHKHTMAHTHTGPSHQHYGYGDGGDLRAAIGESEEGSDSLGYVNVTPVNPKGGGGLPKPHHVVDGDHKYGDSLKSAVPVYGYVSSSGNGNTSESSVSDTGDSGSTIQDIMPPYYALCFIMKL